MGKLLLFILAVVLTYRASQEAHIHEWGHVTIIMLCAFLCVSAIARRSVNVE